MGDRVEFAGLAGHAWDAGRLGERGDVVSVKDSTRGGQFIQAVLPGGKEVIRAKARDENENQ